MRLLTYYQDILLPMRNAILVIFILLEALVFSSSHVYAQEKISAGIAVSVPITDTNVPDGAIVASSSDGYTLSHLAYDPTIYGVVVKKPALSFGSVAQANYYSVITSGKAYVAVNSSNGSIAVGDFVTSSTTPGIGQKALGNGYVIGIALEAYDNKDTKATGRILLSLKPGYNAANVIGAKGVSPLSAVQVAALSLFTTPLTSMRYIVAMIVAGGSFLLGFFYFGKFGKSGLEALGRNPLAKRSISVGMVLTLCVSVSIMLLGVGVGYLIFVL